MGLNELNDQDVENDAEATESDEAFLEIQDDGDDEVAQADRASREPYALQWP